MPQSNQEKKNKETLALSDARSAGVPIPVGEIPGEGPDFSFQTETGALGIEVSELLRPASSNSGIVPAEEEAYHNEVVQIAEKEYYRLANTKPARVVLYFANARGKKRNKCEMARALAKFVGANVDRANPVANFDELDLPEGFGSMSVAAESGTWSCGEGGCFTVSDIRHALTSCICAKNERLQAYRKNLPAGAKVWLLLYSTVAVSHGILFPYGIEEWRFHFDFDRVFWFNYLGMEFIEIQHSEGVHHHAVSIG